MTTMKIISENKLTSFKYFWLYCYYYIDINISLSLCYINFRSLLEDKTIFFWGLILMHIIMTCIYLQKRGGRKKKGGKKKNTKTKQSVSRKFGTMAGPLALGSPASDKHTHICLFLILTKRQIRYKEWKIEFSKHNKIFKKTRLFSPFPFLAFFCLWLGCQVGKETSIS